MSSELSPANPVEALEMLKTGNANYQAGRLKIARWGRQEWEAKRAEAQSKRRPWAVVWGCIDSRVPPELVFDCELGDLFVIRTAGQAPDAAALGSLEFVIKYQNEDKTYPVKLVLVLGHTECRAVQATINHFDPSASPSAEDMGSIPQLVNAIAPAYTAAKIMWKEANDQELWTHLKESENDQARVKADLAGFLEQVALTNVQNQVYELKTNPILAAAERAGRIKIVGAIYNILDGGLNWVTQLPQES